jgi:TRAP-type C4-dicarboxylate transport system substrate-binding protein
VKKYLLLLLVVFIVGALVLGGCSSQSSTSAPAQSTIVMRLAGSAPPVDTQMVVLKELETTIPQKTNGKVKFELYPAAQLYSDPDAVTAVQGGTLEAAISGGTLPEFMPEWDLITSLDFLFNNVAHFEKFMQTDAYKALLAKMETKGMKQVGIIYPFGEPAIWNNKRAINTVEDLRGLKLAQHGSSILQKGSAALGISAMDVPLAELVSSLETKMCDGIEGPPGMMDMMELQRLTPYYARAPFHVYPLGVMVSTKWWNKLPADVQTGIDSAISDAALKFKQAVITNSAKNIQKFKDTPGTTYVEMSASEIAKAQALLKPLRDELGNSNSDLAKIISAVEASR